MTSKTNRRKFFHATGLSVMGLMAAANPVPGIAAEPQNRPAAKTKGQKFRDLYNGRNQFICMGAFDVATARMAEMMGMESLFVASSAVAASYGIPDWSVVSDSERIEFAGRIADGVDIPTFSDVDEGGVSPLTLYRSTKLYEKAGVAAIGLTEGPSGMGGKARTYTIAEQVDRIKAAVDARTDLVVTCRCSTWAAEGKDKTFERAAAYKAAGVEAIWFQLPIADMAQIPASLNLPLIWNTNVETPLSAAKATKAKMILYTTALRDIMLGATYNGLMEFKNTGLFGKTFAANVLPNEIDLKLHSTAEYQEHAKKYNLVK